MSTSRLPEEKYHWLHFIAKSGEEARAWVDELTELGGWEITGTLEQALTALRTSQLDRGRELLDAAWQRIEELPDRAPRSMVPALERWFFAAKAYERHCREDYDGALALLDRADRAVCSAIEQADFLLPLADHCYDFRLQRARVARNARQWDQMKRHIRVGREMMENRCPLCTVQGREIYLEDIDRFYRTVPALSPEEREFLERLLSGRFRGPRFESFVVRIYALPGFVIPYA